MRDGVLGVRHTVQMGHRLWSLPGLCTNLHGHTWDVTLKMTGSRNREGMLLDYHYVKKEFRSYLDSNFDHRLCLHDQDPLIQHIMNAKRDPNAHPMTATKRQDLINALYPGVVTVNFLPSTENMAELWAAAAKTLFGSSFYQYTVELWEGDKNYASVTIE